MAGDIVGINVKGLRRRPQTGDLMMSVSELTGGNVLRFDAQVMILSGRSQITAGYIPLAFVHCGRAPCRLVAIRWKMCKQSDKAQKMESPDFLAPQEMALCTFEPLRPFFCNTFKAAPSLSRVIFLDGNMPVMIGKVVSCERQGEANDKGGKKK